MKRSTKAMLLSALVFPGTGQLLLRRTVRGVALGLICLVAIGYVVARVVNLAMTVCERVIDGAIPPDVEAMTSMTMKLLEHGSLTLHLASYTIAVAWIVGIVDCYLIGRKESPASPAESVSRAEGE